MLSSDYYGCSIQSSDTFYVSLSIEKEFKIHYKVCQTRKDSVQFYDVKQVDIHNRFLHLKLS